MQSTELIKIEQYEQYKNMINSKADSFAYTTGVPSDELKAQGALVFCEALLDYDPLRSSLSTWLHMKLDQRLFTFTKNYTLYQELTSVTLDNIVLITNETFRTIIFHKAMAKLSKDASTIVCLITEHWPAEVLGLKGTEKSKAVRGRIKEYLRKQGWSWSRIWKAFTEIKQTLKEIQ